MKTGHYGNTHNINEYEINFVGEEWSIDMHHGYTRRIFRMEPIKYIRFTRLLWLSISPVRILMHSSIGRLKTFLRPGHSTDGFHCKFIELNPDRNFKTNLFLTGETIK